MMANEVETGERKHVVVMMWDPFLSCLFWGQNATHKCRKKEWKCNLVSLTPLGISDFSSF